MGLLDNFDSLTDSAKQYALNALARFGNGVGNTVQQIPGNAQKLAQGLLNLPHDVSQTFSSQPGGLFSPQLGQQVNQAMSQPQPANPSQWMDQGMALAGMAPVMGLLGHTVYHGSPHKFDAFDMSKIGTGEGAQAYGHGLYFAESPAVAKSYMDAGNAPSWLVNGENVGSHTPTAYAAKLLGTPGTPPKQAVLNSKALLSRINKLTPEKEQYFTDTLAEIDRLEKLAPEIKKASNFYKVDIPDEAIPRMLDWDKPLSQQHPDVQAALQNVPFETAGGDWTGAQLLDAANNYARQGSDIAARNPQGGSDLLRSVGIHGIKYLDGSSRGTGQGTSNFVLFDDQLPRILEVNGQPTGLKPWAEDAAQQAARQPTQYELAHQVAQKNAVDMLGLPPNNTAMDRARAMGFDADNHMYHGALNADQTALTASMGGELGPGSYVTNNPALASEFARKQYGGEYPEGSGVFPVVTRKLESMPRDEWVGTRGNEMDRLRAENGGEWNPDFYYQSMRNMADKSATKGNAGWYTPGEGGANQGVVFDPKNIRSRFAAFDPAKRDSSDLLAGLAPYIGVGGLLSLGLMSPQDKKTK